MNLKSSINEVGKVVTQIIHFKNGEEKTFDNIITESIKVGTFTKMQTTDKKLIAINQKEVIWFETHTK